MTRTAADVQAEIDVHEPIWAHHWSGLGRLSCSCGRWGTGGPVPPSVAYRGFGAHVGREVANLFEEDGAP